MKMGNEKYCFDNQSDDCDLNMRGRELLELQFIWFIYILSGRAVNMLWNQGPNNFSQAVFLILHNFMLKKIGNCEKSYCIRC